MRRPADITLEAVAKHYATPAGPVRALDGITLEIEPGTSVAIMGPSGCGKSTLLGLVGALEVPSSGRVLVGGEEISGIAEPERARIRGREIGLVFQADNLLPFLTALENVCLQLSMQGETDGHGRISELLDAMGLANRAHNLPDQLSRGQRQRVAIARALVHRPGLIVADEPTGSLDGKSSAAIVEVLREAQRAVPATLVVATHDPRVAGQLDRVVTLRDGRVVGDGAR